MGMSQSRERPSVSSGRVELVRHAGRDEHASGRRQGRRGVVVRRVLVSEPGRDRGCRRSAGDGHLRLGDRRRCRRLRRCRGLRRVVLRGRLLGRRCRWRRRQLVGPGTAGLGLDGLRLGRRLRRRLRKACRDPELADGEIVVLAQLDPRPRDERIALAPGVVGEIVGELRKQPLLVALELLAILRREIQVVFVRDVDARERHRSVLVHLLGELAGQLYGLDVRAEGATEDAFEERLDAVLDASQQRCLLEDCSSIESSLEARYGGRSSAIRIRAVRWRSAMRSTSPPVCRAPPSRARSWSARPRTGLSATRSGPGRWSRWSLRARATRCPASACSRSLPRPRRSSATSRRRSSGASWSSPSYGRHTSGRGGSGAVISSPCSALLGSARRASCRSSPARLRAKRTCSSGAASPMGRGSPTGRSGRSSRRRPTAGASRSFLTAALTWRSWPSVSTPRSAPERAAPSRRRRSGRYAGWSRRSPVLPRLCWCSRTSIGASRRCST